MPATRAPSMATFELSSTWPSAKTSWFIVTLCAEAYMGSTCAKTTSNRYTEFVMTIAIALRCIDPGEIVSGASSDISKIRPRTSKIIRISAWQTCPSFLLGTLSRSSRTKELGENYTTYLMLAWFWISLLISHYIKKTLWGFLSRHCNGCCENTSPLPHGASENLRAWEDTHIRRRRVGLIECFPARL